MNHYRLQHVLLPDGWAQDVTVQVDANGIIAAVDAGGTSSRPATANTGPAPVANDRA